MTTTTTLPEWLNLDEILPVDDRTAIQSHVRAVAETIVEVRGVFEAARASLAAIDNKLGDVPEDVYDVVCDYTSVQQLWTLLNRFAEVVSPESNDVGLQRRVEQLDAELARVPGLG